MNLSSRRSDEQLQVIDPGHGGLIASSRRSFLNTVMAGSFAMSSSGLHRALGETKRPENSERNHFTLARIMYQGAWDAAHPNSDRNLMREFEVQTQNRVLTNNVQLTLADRRIFRYPMLYLTGMGVEGSFSPQEADRLRQHLVNGGFLYASDCSGGGNTFHRSVTRFIEVETFRNDSALVRLRLDRDDHPLLNLVVPFGDWSPGVYFPGRFTAWEYEGRLVAYMVSQFDHNCILAARGNDIRLTNQTLWQSCNVLYYAMTH